LLAVFLLANEVWAANQTLEDVERVPTSYGEFWNTNEWLLENLYYVGIEIAFFEYTRAIEVENIRFSEEGLVASIPENERNKFSESIDAFRRMWDGVEDVKTEKAAVYTLLTQWVLFLPVELELGESINFELQFPGLPHLISRVRRALSGLPRALVFGGAAVNHAFLVLESDFDKLDHMGVDNANYSGKAKPAYLKIADIIAFAHIDMPEGDYKDFARAYASSRSLAKRIQAIYATIPSGSVFAAIPIYDEAINSFGNAFLAAVRLDGELGEAIEAMNSEYREKELGAASASSSLRKRTQEMEAEGYGLIDEKVVRFFLRPSEEVGVSIPTPKDSLQNAEWNLNEAEDAQAEAKRLSASTSVEDYLALAIERLGVAELRLKQAEVAADESEGLARRLEADAEAMVEEELGRTRAVVEGFQPLNEAEAGRKANASMLLGEAEG